MKNKAIETKDNQNPLRYSSLLLSLLVYLYFYLINTHHKYSNCIVTLIVKESEISYSTITNKKYFERDKS